MAYNPFNFFRRNQKTFFGILTVFVMIMFTLSFGPGDFFQSLPRWLGSQRGRGEVIAVVDGSKVYESELSARRADRVLANDFMARANGVALNNTFQYVSQSAGQVSEANKSAVDMALMIHRALTGQEQRFDPRMLPQLTDVVLGQLNEVLAKSPAPPKDDLEVLRAARDLILLDAMQGMLARSQVYFVNQPNQSNKDLLEYDLWLRKADKLGIDYTASNARELVTREFYGRFGEADYKAIEAELRKNRERYSKERLETALANEFKVRAAQSVVLGPITARTPNPGLQAFSTPYEDYKYFREQCVGATYGVIAVPAENLVAQVSGRPTEAELREIFQKYRNTEPNPASETPGLKEPRKLKLQWLEVRGDEPFYQAAATDALQKAETQAKLAGFLTAPLGPAGFGYLAAPAPFVLGDPALSQAYSAYQKEFEAALRVRWLGAGGFASQFEPAPPMASSFFRPANLAAAAGAAAGSALTLGSPLTAPVVFEQQVKMEERHARARVAAALLAPPVLTSPNVIGSALAATARLPAPPPLPVVRGELMAKVRAELARDIAQRDLEKFQTEMAKLGAKRDKSEVRAYLDGFVKARNLKVGGSQDFRDQYAIGDDPGLAPLKEKMDRGPGMTRSPVQFGREFFFEQNFRTRQLAPATTFYAPQPYPQQGMSIPGMPSPVILRENEPSYLVWRTEEVPAEAPKSFEAARAKAEAAWRLAKARDLAKQEAERLAKEAEAIPDQPGTVDKELRDLHAAFQKQFPDPAAKERAKYFLIHNVTPIPPVPVFGSNMMPGQSQYEMFTLRPTTDLPYPTQQMLDELLKNKDKPFSTAVVLPDQGKRTYYVAVVKDRRDVGIEEFYSKVYSGTRMDELGRMINERHRVDEQIQAREQAVALLKAEFRVEKESQKLNEKTEAAAE